MSGKIASVGWTGAAFLRFVPVLLVTLVFVAYAPLFAALVAIGPEVTRRVLAGEHLGFALYTLAAYCLPVAFAAVLVVQRMRGLEARRVRLGLLIASALNWLPLCVAVFGWVLLAHPGSWVP